MRWILLPAAILSEVAGSVSLKAALDRPVLYIAVVTGYAASFAFLAGVLRAGMGLGVAYGVWAALGVALTALMSAVLFAEPLTALMAVGIALVVAGVFTVEVGAQRADRRQGSRSGLGAA